MRLHTEYLNTFDGWGGYTDNHNEAYQRYIEALKAHEEVFKNLSEMLEA
jgi:hypothetical protein